jgi:hypothetical protein
MQSDLLEQIFEILLVMHEFFLQSSSLPQFEPSHLLFINSAVDFEHCEEIIGTSEKI